MIRPELARYMLRNKGRNAALRQGGLARLTHDNLADLGVTPRPLEDEGPEETAAEGGVEESFHAPVAIAEAPQGQLDVPPQAAMPGAAPEELDAFPQPFSPAPMTQAVAAPVSAPRVEAESDDADDLANARANDRTAAIARGFETAGRQLVAGISRTPILDTLTQQTNQAGEVRAAQKSREESRATKLRQAAEMARQSRMDDNTIANSEADRIEKLARAAALSRDRRQDPTIAAQQLERLKTKDANDLTLGTQRNEIARLRAERAPTPKAGPAAAPEDDIRELAKRVGDSAPTLVANLDRIDELMAKYPDDLPGIGLYDGRKPMSSLDADGQDARNVGQALADTLLNIQSGAGVSDQERQRKYDQYGIGGGDEKVFRAGMKRIRGDITAALKAKEAGFKPEVVNVYRQRGGLDSEKISGGNQPAPPAAGTVEVTHKSGKKKKVSAGAAELLRAGGDWK